MKIEDGILMLGRFSVGWNFHHSREVKTFGLALTWARGRGGRRWLVTVGPITFIWLL